MGRSRLNTNAKKETRKEIYNKVIEMYGLLYSDSKIAEKLSVEYKVSQSLVYKYCAYVRNKVALQNTQDLNQVRDQHKEFLHNMLTECLANAKRCDNDRYKAIYINQALDYYKELCKLYPNQLQPIQELQEAGINIKFEVV
jgi:hypothetical protein